MKKKIKMSGSDRIYYTVVWIMVTLFMLAVLYPIIYIVSSSFSSGRALMTGKVFLWPVDPSAKGYINVIQYKGLMKSFGNSVFYTVVGTAYNIALTIICAYPLSRKDLPGRGYFTFFFTLTMFINGGLIPNYLLVKNLGMLDTRWSLIIPVGVSVYNMLIVRNYFQTSIPGELLEASQIDGCSDFKYLCKILLPLSKASIAVIALFYAVSHWNSYFRPMMYLMDRDLVPLQTILREILVNNEIEITASMDKNVILEQETLAHQLKYALIVVSSVPMLIIYPFVQKYFVKGVMVGSIKG